MTSILTDRDTATMVGLLSEVAAKNGTLQDKRAILMDGLCEMIGED